MESTTYVTAAIATYLGALNAGAEPDPQELFELESALASLLVKIERLADQRDPAGNASNQPDGLTPLEVAEALVQTIPETIQQSGGDPIKIDMIEIDFDPETEAATDAPTRFWMRADSGETFNIYVRRNLDDDEPYLTGADLIDDSMPAESQIYPLDR